MEKEPFESFNVARALVQPLLRVRPALYWADFLFTMGVAWTTFFIAAAVAWHTWPVKITITLISILAFFRGLIFIHEIAHVPLKDLPGFRWVWNAVCGMFFFMPDYTYAPHAFHHSVASFSTKDDPEYLPVAFQRPFEILSPYLVFPLVPLLLAFRFLVAGPLSLVIGGKFREWLLRYASTLKMNPQYEWKNISAANRRLAGFEDVACVAWWALFITVCYRIGGVGILAEAYFVMYGALVVNHFRSLARHRYINETGDKVSYEAQILDSVTIAGFSPLATLLMPVGLRYHSVHHMFPTLPYYSLGRAHQILWTRLPERHIYRKTVVPSFLAAMRNFIRTVQTHEPQPVSV